MSWLLALFNNVFLGLKLNNFDVSHYLVYSFFPYIQEHRQLLNQLYE
jgi:hypothetical protein